MLTPEIVKAVDYKKITVNCEKCKGKIVYETDYLTEVQAKAQHKCQSTKLIAQSKAVKNEKGK